MIWIIAALVIGFIIGVIVGVVWTNIAISNTIGRHFGMVNTSELTPCND